MTQEQARQAAQLAFVASGAELEVGRPEASPIDPDALARIEPGSPLVVEAMPGGLTARVFRLRAGGRDWTLKRARVPCLVKNVDGQTSFLNELQRRADLARLQAAPGGDRRFAAIVETAYGSLRRGVLLSPWIEGETVASWDERRITQLLDVLVELSLEGLFEWDLCPGNVLDDGRQLRLFDFGYMYRYDPLTQPHSGGWGAPVFHPAERFETRNFSAQLLALEQSQGLSAALAAYRLEKGLAVQAYERLRAALRARGASAQVLEWLEGILARWRSGLRGDLGALYLAEGWRSHRLDVLDDLHGQTCTPRTLQRLEWLSRTLREHASALTALGAFFFGDAELPLGALAARLEEDAVRARGWQVA
ncbi:MAG: hypothetical protein QM767_12335 [Anaeromyxobacter sp.]